MTVALLIAQAVLAIVGIRAVAVRVTPNIGHLPHPGVVLDVWLPLVAVLPLVATALRGADTNAGAPWSAIGAPIAVGAIGLAAALLAPGRGGAPMALPARALPIWSATAVVLLLLVALGRMPLIAGQCAFAVAAVLLWINTPPHDRHAPPHPVESPVGLGLLVAVLCAGGQAVAAHRVEPTAAPIAAALAAAFAVVVVVLAVRAEPGAAARVGAWAACYGVLFTLGVVALRTMIPAALIVLRGGFGPSPGTPVAGGFRGLVVEATALLLLGPASAVAARAATVPAAARLAGAALLVGAAVLVGLRIT